MAPAPSTALEERDLLIATLAGDRRAGFDLEARLSRVLLRAARARAPHLPPELYADVVQEAWLAVLTRPGEQWRSGAVSVRGFMKRLVRDAVKTVYAGHRQPGVRSRMASRSKLPAPRVATPTPEPKDIPDTADVEDEVLTRVQVEAIFRRAAPDTRVALRLLYFEGATLVEVAAETGMSRRTLGRRLAELTTAA